VICSRPMKTVLQIIHAIAVCAITAAIVGYLRTPRLPPCESPPSSTPRPAAQTTTSPSTYQPVTPIATPQRVVESPQLPVAVNTPRTVNTPKSATISRDPTVASPPVAESKTMLVREPVDVMFDDAYENGGQYVVLGDTLDSRRIKCVVSAEYYRSTPKRGWHKMPANVCRELLP